MGTSVDRRAASSYPAARCETISFVGQSPREARRRPWQPFIRARHGEAFAVHRDGVVPVLSGAPEGAYVPRSGLDQARR